MQEIKIKVTEFEKARVCLIDNNGSTNVVNALGKHSIKHRNNYSNKCEELEKLDQELNNLLKECHFKEASSFLTETQEEEFSLIKIRESLCGK